MAGKKLCNLNVHSVAFLLIILLTTLASPLALAQSTYTVLYSFSGGADGSSPQAGLLRDASGNIYGTTANGGIARCGQYQSGCGVVFKLDSAGHYTTLYAFTSPMDGYWPQASVVLDAAGNLYGTTPNGGLCMAGGPPCSGTAFRLDRSGNHRVLHAFTGKTDGAYPQGGLVLDSIGNLYGTTVFGGPFCGLTQATCGVLFKLDPTGHETVLHNFMASEGMNPMAALVRDAAGNIYGTTPFGGAPYFNGVVFKLDPAGHYTVLHAFNGNDGISPANGVILDAAGNLYGTTNFGGNLSCNPPNGCGVVFKLDPTGHETLLHVFNGPDGIHPNSVVLDNAGNLYGTTYGGGPNDWGLVFKLDRTGNMTVLHTFAGNDGQHPMSVVLDAAGNLYGTASSGGAYGPGVVFKLTLP